MSDSEIDVRFSASTGGAESGADRVKGKLGEVRSETERLEEQFKRLSERLVEYFAIRELSEFVNKITELGEQAIRSAAMLGMTVEEVQKLGFAAKMTGGEAEGMNMAMGRFERNIAEAQQGSGKAYQAFLNLGISLQDLKAKTPNELLGMVADKFHDTADGAVKYAYAVDLGGRSWGNMIPLLDKGSEGLKAIGEQAEQTGSILNGAQAEALEKTHQKLIILKASMTGLGISIEQALEPAINGLIDGLTVLTTCLKAAVDFLRAVSLAIDGMILISIAKLIEVSQEMGVNLTTNIEKIKISFETLGHVIDDVVHLHFEKAADEWVEGAARIEAANSKAAARIGAISGDYERLKSKIAETTAAQINLGREQDKEGKKKADLPPVPTGKKDDTSKQLALEDVRFEEQMGKLRIANEKDVLDQKVAMGAISKKEEFAQLQQLADEEYGIEKKSLEDAAKLDGLSTVEKQKLDDQLLLLHQKYLNQREALNRKAALDERKQFDQLFQGIDRAFTTSINGILQGTQTWQQAMGRIFIGVLSVFVDMAEKMAAKWIETQLINAIYGKTEAAASIASDAATAGAAAYASTAAIPIVGPELAPAAAAQAYGATMAFQGLVALETGAWEIPSTIPALLHPGEMVVPQAFAQSLRDKGSFGGGGGDVHLHVTAVDGASVKKLFMENGAALAAALSKQSRNFNPHAPGWKS